MSPKKKGKQPTALKQGAVGAIVRYCGHEGTFVADILLVAGAAVVRAPGPVTGENLNRDPVSYRWATHWLLDFPCAGYWRPDQGTFVVPAKQVRVFSPSP
jgi:hypothetical protein